LIKDFDGAFLEQLVQSAARNFSRNEPRQLRTPPFQPGPETASSSVQRLGEGRHSGGTDLSQRLPRIGIVVQQLLDPVTGRLALVMLAAVAAGEQAEANNCEQNGACGQGPVGKRR